MSACSWILSSWLLNLVPCALRLVPSKSRRLEN